MDFVFQFVLAILVVSIFIFTFLAIQKREEKFALFQILNTLSNVFVLTIALYVYYIDRYDFIDLALIYVFLSYSSTLAFIKFYDLKNKES